MKQQIGIDVDGVLRNFSSDLHRVIKEHYPEYIIDEVDTPKEMTDWDLENSSNAPKHEIQRIYREEHAETIFQIPICHFLWCINLVYDVFWIVFFNNPM
jgi:5'(3')-deoxyribonucleotidase